MTPEKLDIKLIYNKIKNLSFQIKNLSLYLIATISSTFIKVLINPFLAANLSPDDYAVIGYFFSFTTLFLPIISFSLLTYYARNFFLVKVEERAAILNTLILAQIILGLLTLAFVLTGFYFYMQISKVNFPFFPYAFLTFIPVFFNCFYNFLLVEKRMKRQAMSYFKIILINTISTALLAILFVVILNQGAIGRFWSLLLPAVGMGFYSIFKLVTKFQYNWKIFKDAIAFGWPISLAAILYYFMSGIDIAMLEQLNDPKTLGIFVVAVQITGYLYMFYAAIVQTFEPDIYKAISDDNRKKLIQILAGIIVLNAIPTGLFIIFANPVIRILTYGKYVASTEFAQVLAIKNIPLSLCFLSSNVIIGYGYPKVELINRAIGAFLSVIMFKILIDKFGFWGAAWGQSISLILMTLISASFLLYKFLATKKTHG